MVQRSSRALVPRDRQRLARRHGLPVAVGHHGHAVVDLHHVDHAGHAFDLAGVKADHLAANHRALLDAGVNHAGQLHINPELRRAVDFGGRVQAFGAFSDDFERRRVFQCGLFRHGHARRRFSQFAIARFFALGAEHVAVVGLDQVAVYVPAGSGGGDEHFTHLGTGDAQLLPAVAHRGRSAGDLRTQQRVHIDCAGWGDSDFDFADVNVQLLSDQHRHGGVDALAHLRAR